MKIVLTAMVCGILSFGLSSSFAAEVKSVPQEQATEGKKIKTVVVEVEERRFPPRSIPALERPNSVMLEILGRGGSYSFLYDRALTESWSIGGGLSIQSAASATYIAVPVYGNFYFAPQNDRFYATAGLTLASASVGGISTLVVTTGAGYEFRGDKGLLGRIGPYLNFGASVAIWFGVSVGYSFL